MDPHLIGSTAAIVVSLFWTFCSIFFAIAGKRVGVLSVNALRIVMAIGLLGATHIILFGTIMPAANREQWMFMGLSGIIGLSLGDFGYFGSLVILGPRRGVLIMSTHPIVSALFGYIILGESLSAWAIVGIAVTLAGVVWVILEREESEEGKEGEEVLDDKKKTLGILLGIGGSIGQGLGLVVSKYGMFEAGNPEVPLDPLPATLIRMVVAAAFFWLVVAAMGKLPEVARSTKDTKAIGAMFGGAFLGPFLGVWLSMVAVTYTLTGIAATLMALMPVMVIPIVWVLDKQRTTWRGFIGAVVAIVGVAILFLM
jgi:drug/metabolite transporter (DMT)-like permease